MFDWFGKSGGGAPIMIPKNKKSIKKDNKDVIIKALVRDIVELSLSARKVVETGSFYMKDMQEVIILDSMAKEILKRHTVEAPNEEKK